MITTLDIVGAFILGGLIPFGTVGAVGGYYWARADVRRAVFKWLHDTWPEDYNEVYREIFHGIEDTDAKS